MSNTLPSRPTAVEHDTSCPARAWDGDGSRPAGGAWTTYTARHDPSPPGPPDASHQARGDVSRPPAEATPADATAGRRRSA